MKKILITLVLIVSVSTAFVGCRDEKSTGEKIEEKIEDAGDDIEDAADDVADEIEDAVE